MKDANIRSRSRTPIMFQKVKYDYLAHNIGQNRNEWENYRSAQASTPMPTNVSSTGDMVNTN